MTLLWHIAKKDLRHLRWPFAAWILLTVIDALLRAVGPLFIDVTRNDTWYTLDAITNFVPLIRGLLYLVIVAIVVLADPLVGTEAFWLTRPIPRRTLFASKLLVAVLILVVPSLLTEIVLMFAFGVPAVDIAAVVPDILLGSILLLVAFLFAATLAGTLTQFILGFVGAAIAGWIAIAIIAMLSMMRMKDFEFPLPRVATSPAVEVIVLALALILFAGTTWYHYRTRRRGLALLLALASCGVVYVVGEAMPPIRWIYGGPPELPAAMQDPTVTSLRLTRPIRHVYDERPYFDGPRQRRIAAPLVLDGVLDGYVSGPFMVSASVHMPGGAVLHSKRSPPVIVDVDSGHARTGGGSYLSLGPVRPRKPGASVETWPVLFRAPVDDLRQAADEAGDYSGTFLYDFARVEALTTMPMQREMRFADGPRSLTVWVLGERGGACSLLVRRTTLQGRGWPLRQPVLSDRFHDRARGQGTTFHMSRGSDYALHFGGGWSTNTERGHWFHIAYQVIDLLPEGQIHGAPATESLSCSDLALVLERRSYAGRLVRTLTLPGFHLQAQPGDLTGDESNAPY